jgi:hypothetical protein
VVAIDAPLVGDGANNVKAADIFARAVAATSQGPAVSNSVSKKSPFQSWKGL